MRASAGQWQRAPASQGIPGVSANSAPFSPPSDSALRGRARLGPSRCGVKGAGLGPREHGHQAATASARRLWRAWPRASWRGAPGGREGGGRGEGGEEEQSAGPRRQDFLVWGLSTAQKEKRRAAEGSRGAETGPEGPRGCSLARPPLARTPEAAWSRGGLKRSSPASDRETLPASEEAPELRRGGRARRLLFWRENFSTEMPCWGRSGPGRARGCP